jgi:hypothetical protein
MPGVPFTVSGGSGRAELPGGEITACELASRLGASAALAQNAVPGWTWARYPLAVFRLSCRIATIRTGGPGTGGGQSRGSTESQSAAPAASESETVAMRPG